MKNASLLFLTLLLLLLYFSTQQKNKFRTIALMWGYDNMVHLKPFFHFFPVRSSTFATKKFQTTTKIHDSEGKYHEYFPSQNNPFIISHTYATRMHCNWIGAIHNNNNKHCAYIRLNRIDLFKLRAMTYDIWIISRRKAAFKGENCVIPSFWRIFLFSWVCVCWWMIRLFSFCLLWEGEIVFMVMLMTHRHSHQFSMSIET